MAHSNSLSRSGRWRLTAIGGRRANYFIRKLAQIVFVALAIAVLNFLLLHAIPGDIVDAIAGEAGAASPDYVEELRRQFGLDRSMLSQLFIYIGNLVQFDLGYSFRHGVSVQSLVFARILPTVMIVVPAVFLAVIMGCVLGVWSAVRANKPTDRIISALSLFAFSTPVFWSGLMAIVLFSVHLGWLPSGGYETIGSDYRGVDRILDIMTHMILPVASLTLFFVAIYTKLMRSSMIEVLQMDYITTARAKGVSGGRILWRHALRNGILPVVTMIGLQMGTVIGGSILIETVFNWPGVGNLVFDAVLNRDANIVLGVLFLSSIVVLIANVIVDVCFTLIDPRIELGGR